jgi:hypothetical protein
MVILVKIFLKVSMSASPSQPSLWSMKSRREVKNSFRYAFIIVVSLVVTMFDI